MEDDRIVIGRIKGGDVEAFAVLVEKYHRSVLTFIHRLTGDERNVEDIGQEVFLDVYRSLKDFDEKRGTPFSAWLFIAARNRCISEMRKRKRPAMVSLEEISDLGAEVCTAESALIEHENRMALRACLAKLSEPFKSTLLMSLRGCSFEEIAGGCGISVGTAKSRIHRAREKMKLFVKEYFGGKGYERI